jgi:hypothetical protein
MRVPARTPGHWLAKLTLSPGMSTFLGLNSECTFRRIFLGIASWYLSPRIGLPESPAVLALSPPILLGLILT